MLFLLVIFSTIQAIQLNSLKENIQELGTIDVPIVQISGSGAAIPSNIQNLPQMVGGCWWDVEGIVYSNFVLGWWMH